MKQVLSLVSLLFAVIFTPCSLATDYRSLSYCAWLLPSLLQAKATLEKTKATLEAENQEMASDLKSVQMAKVESERKRKQAEQQLAELSIRLQEMEQARAETTEKAIKLAQELEQVSRCC